MTEQPQWYAIRVTYSREVKLKQYLDSINIKSFIPMHYVEVVRKGRKCKVVTPVVHNLIFIFSIRKVLDRIKQELSFKIPIRYIMDKAAKQPIVVPEKDMSHFIAVSGTLDERLLFLTKVEPILKQGRLNPLFRRPVCFPTPV